MFRAYQFMELFVTPRLQDPMAAKSAEAPLKHFNLRLWFATGGLATIAIAFFGIGLWLSGFLTDSLLAREGEISREFFETVVQVNGADMFADDTSQPLRQTPMLLDFAKHVMSLPGMQRVNMHSRSGRVIWSTEPQLVGQVFTDNDELSDAFSGKVVNTLIEAGEDDKGEHVALAEDQPIIESYLPMRAGVGGGDVIGVVEFYRLPLALIDTLRNGRMAIWVAVVISAVALFGILYIIVGKGAEIIERQQANLARVEAFAAIGQMASAVAHSLRNPMAAIRSSAELWRSTLGDEGRQTANEIIADVDRMDGYVRDLLAYARHEPQHLQPLDPMALMAEIVKKHGRAAERNGVVVSLQHDASGVRVLADQSLLEQALTSIVTNAIEAMPEGGSLSVALRHESGEKAATIEVTDTGKGMAPELLEKAAHTYFTTKARGMGLGLVLAKSIIERLGGKLALRRAKDAGTQVDITLRLA